jgi:hypothetical protein
MNGIAWLALLLAACAAGGGCSRGHRSEHTTERHASEPAPPTPDTTPIAALKTPAGLVLGVEETPASGTPEPAQTAVAPSTTATPAP